MTGAAHTRVYKKGCNTAEHRCRLTQFHPIHRRYVLPNTSCSKSRAKEPYFHVLPQHWEDRSNIRLEGGASSIGSRRNGTQRCILRFTVARPDYFQQFGHQGFQVTLQLIRTCHTQLQIVTTQLTFLAFACSWNTLHRVACCRTTCKVLGLPLGMVVSKHGPNHAVPAARCMRLQVDAMPEDDQLTQHSNPR